MPADTPAAAAPHSGGGGAPEACGHADYEYAMYAKAAVAAVLAELGLA